MPKRTYPPERTAAAHEARRHKGGVKSDTARIAMTEAAWEKFRALSARERGELIEKSLQAL